MTKLCQVCFRPYNYVLKSEEIQTEEMYLWAKLSNLALSIQQDLYFWRITLKRSLLSLCDISLLSHQKTPDSIWLKVLSKIEVQTEDLEQGYFRCSLQLQHHSSEHSNMGKYRIVFRTTFTHTNSSTLWNVSLRLQSLWICLAICEKWNELKINAKIFTACNGNWQLKTYV